MLFITNKRRNMSSNHIILGGICSPDGLTLPTQIMNLKCLLFFLLLIFRFAVRKIFIYNEKNISQQQQLIQGVMFTCALPLLDSLYSNPSI